MKKLPLILLLTALSSVVTTHAQDANDAQKATKEQAITYEAPIIGVTTKFNPDGSLRSIMATGEAELVFGDRKDIRQALQKATMRAKASISKFMTEKLQSNETMEEITDTIMASTPNNSTATRDSISKHVETISNSSEAILMGVVPLKQAVHKNEKYVEVTVGMKKETIDSATELGQQINKGQSQIKQQPANGTSNTQNKTSAEDDVRTSAMYEDF